MSRKKPRPSAFGNLTQLASGRWRARYRNPLDKSQWINAGGKGVSYPTKTMGRKALDKIDQQIAEGTWLHPDEVEAQRQNEEREAALRAEQEVVDRFTVGEWVALWLELLEHKQSSANTIRTYTSDIKPFLEAFKDVPLKELTREALSDWQQGLGSYNRRLQDGSLRRVRRTDTTRRKIHRIVRACLNDAVEAGRLPVNPLPPIAATTRKGKGIEKRVDYIPTPAEICAAVEAAHPVIGAAVMLAYHAGLRSGEIRALRREHMILSGKRPVIRVRSAIQRAKDGTQVVGPCKTQSSVRDVPISREVAAWLSAYMLEYVEPNQEALFVYNPNSKEILSEKSLWHGKGRWKEARKAAGIRDVCNFHYLRKVCLTNLGRAGATTAQLMHFAGHSDAKTVQIYQLSDAESLASLVNRSASGTDGRSSWKDQSIENNAVLLPSFRAV